MCTLNSRGARPSAGVRRVRFTFQLAHHELVHAVEEQEAQHGRHVHTVAEEPQSQVRGGLPEVGSGGLQLRATIR